MKRIYKCLSFFLAFVLNLALVSCVNEIFDNGPEDLDGECNVSFELQGLPLQSALTRTAGNAIREVGNLYILFYTKGSAANEADYKLAYAFTTDKECHNDVFSKDHYLEVTSKDDLDRTSGTAFDPGDGEWKGVAESTTKYVKTSEVQVKRGDYAVYVVANVDEFSLENFSEDDIATVGDLRNYQLTWNADNIAANNAMFGFFTADAQEYDVINKAAPLIKITSKAITLHAWVKRAVSKVTVAFDGRNLFPGVRVYIKNVKICDIPNTCKLGADNEPDKLSDLITNGEVITYTSTPGATNDTRISKEEPFFPDFPEGWLAEDSEKVAEWKGIVHAEDSERTLYFFENLQGESRGDVDADGSWKQQTDIDGNGIPDDRDHNNIQKDTKDYGTYIEVEAYYHNDNFGMQSEGSIIYRFMLGKNTTNDFNAERNNHYKLTLCFNKNANDVDWHIDYNEEPGDYTPETIYVSYEYNTPSILPVRFVFDGEKKVTDLSVEIVSSNWYPDEPSIPYYKAQTASPSGPATGFLSLHYDSNPKIGDDQAVTAAVVSNYWETPTTNHTRQYIINGETQKCDYIINKGTPNEYTTNFGYGVTRRTNSDGNMVFEANIPLFTRPLMIYKWTSWTGANPFYTSSRTAWIKLKGTVDNRPYEKDIKVVQVPRIENPSGIYRQYNNTDKFEVICMARTGEMWDSPTTFNEFNSVGAWRATIYKASDGNGATNNWFTLTKGAQKADVVGEYIQGDPNSPIKFTYKPNELPKIGPNDVRCGIIKVEYNNYACTHYIFVRQGYAPMQLEENQVYWHTFNLYSSNAETNHPCEAGSLFVRSYLSPAILDTNPQKFGQPNIETDFDVIDSDGRTVTMSREDIYGLADGGKDTPFLIDPQPGRIPYIAEWATLKNAIAVAQIDKGFGVLYGDGATETQTIPDNVWGCLHADVTNGKTSKGMRGCFVYNTTDGRNIFLPIGASGFGRRKMASLGQLQYGLGNSFDSHNFEFYSYSWLPRRALLVNLYSNEGAVYWSKNLVAAGELDGFTKPSNSWDINYKTYDFDYMDSRETNTAACYIRLVQTTAP